jgi:hypothetical protein
MLVKPLKYQFFPNFFYIHTVDIQFFDLSQKKFKKTSSKYRRSAAKQKDAILMAGAILMAPGGHV